MMNYLNFFSRQARKPSGLFGRFYMSRLFDTGNSELNRFIKESLAIEENDHSLEIGFGTGKLIEEIADSLNQGMIEGIDFSESMFLLAEKKNKKHIISGNVKLHLGDFNDTFFDDNCFDKIFSVNTIYFWENPEEIINKIHRILKPGGKLVIGYHDKDEMEAMPLCQNVFKYYSRNDITELLSYHGSFKKIDILYEKGGNKTCYCAVGIK